MTRRKRLSQLKGSQIVESKQSGERITVSELVWRVTHVKEGMDSNEEWLEVEDPNRVFVWERPIKIVI